MTSLILILGVTLQLTNEGTTSFANGLQTSIFDLPEGRITVYLPADFTAGDTISGTVIATPAGLGDELSKNSAVLEGMVVEISGEAPKKGGIQPQWIVPTALGGMAVLSLKDKSGITKSVCPIPVLPPSSDPIEEGKFWCDPISSVGKPLHIQGSFDGVLDNTMSTCGDKPLQVVAESPSSCIVVGTPNTPGPAKIQVSDKGKSAEMPCNFINVKLSAGKTTLLEGEKTNLQIAIEGLQGLPENAYPIPCEIINESPAVVKFESEEGDTHAFGIEFSQVVNGFCNINMNLIGLTPGKFVLRANVFSVKIHDIKKLMDAQSFRAWVNALIIQYEESVKALEKEIEELRKQGRSTGGLDQKLTRHKNILRELRANVNFSRQGLGDAKFMVDKLLSDDSLFRLASSLTTTAADLLGYSDLPLPKIGGIIKGLKTFCGKLPKAMKALEKAEKIFEALEKAQSAAEKAQKAKELKEALNEVNDALN